MFSGLTGGAEVRHVFVRLSALNRGCDFPSTPPAVGVGAGVYVELMSGPSRAGCRDQFEPFVRDGDDAQRVEDAAHIDIPDRGPRRGTCDVEDFANEPVINAGKACRIPQRQTNLALFVGCEASQCRGAVEVGRDEVSTGHRFGGIGHQRALFVSPGCRHVWSRLVHLPQRSLQETTFHALRVPNTPQFLCRLLCAKQHSTDTFRADEPPT